LPGVATAGLRADHQSRTTVVCPILNAIHKRAVAAMLRHLNYHKEILKKSDKIAKGAKR